MESIMLIVLTLIIAASAAFQAWLHAQSTRERIRLIVGTLGDEERISTERRNATYVAVVNIGNVPVRIRSFKFENRHGWQVNPESNAYHTGIPIPVDGIPLAPKEQFRFNYLPYREKHGIFDVIVKVSVETTSGTVVSKAIKHRKPRLTFLRWKVRLYWSLRRIKKSYDIRHRVAYFELHKRENPSTIDTTYYANSQGNGCVTVKSPAWDSDKLVYSYDLVDVNEIDGVEFVWRANELNRLVSATEEEPIWVPRGGLRYASVEWYPRSDAVRDALKEAADKYEKDNRRASE